MLTGECDARSVVEVVVPEGVQSHAAAGWWIEQLNVLRLVFAEQNDRAGRGGGPRRCGDLGNDVWLTGVEETLRGIQPQAVQVELTDPARGVLRVELAHRAAARPVEVDRFTPFVLIAIGEVVGAEAAQVISIGPEMVVDDIENDAEPQGVGSIDEASKGVRLSIAMIGRKQADPVIAPVEATGKIGHRHDFEAGDAEPGKVRQFSRGGFESALLRERADVQFIEDLARERQPTPLPVMPFERIRVDHHRGPMRAARLKARTRIGIGAAIVEPVSIQRAHSPRLPQSREIAVGLRF